MSLANRNLLLRGCTSPEPHARGFYICQIISQDPSTTRKEGTALLPMYFGFQAECAKLHGNLDSDKIQPKEGNELLCVRCTGDSCHVETPAKPSIHSTRIEQSPNLPDPWAFGSITQSPCLCQTHVSTACEGVTTGETLFVCKAFAPKNHSPRAAAGSREGLVVLQSTYLCHGILCVTLESSTKSGQ
ncbi:uncharacterized protein K444DRAFT_112044 [Hyaloscypha bicolor E]|uniref:Uncharacterized protein n=1 Tax=Hyaloscypha bicolor E TaxID=1095630 RepID=A0A2J6SVD0_9HELO|nr:uncharacterized protein K444DRAFT_112044 [Hyaloscypha bicolor E]PMD54727.1 hypothetical protein K444DRAFT_112044 [Hyaloscypha bicolor E]